MLIERLNTDFEHKDDRGTLVQLVRKGYSQINVITSKSGVFRGGHFHKLNTEAFYIIEGKCIVTARKDGAEERQEFSAGDFFRVGPYVSHDFDYVEDTVLVSMYSLGVELDDGKMDSFVMESK
ncbi:MAG: cupin domain-containing protein [Lachnospiraceae bacterium]|nr:cupin domain-containing protein [Dorea sp.]MCI9176878.1 cupin domain-containing protein [Lachnospiraceae bacterium]